MRRQRSLLGRGRGTLGLRARPSGWEGALTEGASRGVHAAAVSAQLPHPHSPWPRRGLAPFLAKLLLPEETVQVGEAALGIRAAGVGALGICVCVGGCTVALH